MRRRRLHSHDHDSRKVHVVMFCRRVRRGRRDRSMDSLGRRNCRRSSRTTTAGRNEPPPVTPTPNFQNSRSRSAESAWSLGAVVSGIAPEHVGPRRDAASAGRQFEKCAAGAPIRGGADSPPPRGSPIGPTDWAPALGLPKPERPSSGNRRRCIFPRVRPRAPWPDVLRRNGSR